MRQKPMNQWFQTFIVCTVILAVYALPQVVEAQFDPKEEDIIWKLEKQPNDRFLSNHFIDENRLLFANRGKAEIRSVEDASIIRTAPSQHSFNFGFVPNPSRTRFVAGNGDDIWLWDIETLSIITSIKVEDFNIGSIAISESGKYVAAVGGPNSARDASLSGIPKHPSVFTRGLFLHQQVLISLLVAIHWQLLLRKGRTS